MKLHKTQVDGINQIDQMSFDNFNECTRLLSCLEKHQEQYQLCTRIGADQIYANNANRVELTKQGVITSFPKKGKDTSTKGYSVSFGNEKNHYGLKKVKALSEGTEKIWVFLGIMTANAVQISKRKPPKIESQAA